MKLPVAEEEVNDVLNACAEAADSGASRFPSSSYEDGVAAAIRWLTEPDADHPLHHFSQ